MYPWTCWGYEFVADEVRKIVEAVDAEEVLTRHSEKGAGGGLVACPQDEASNQLEVGSNYSSLDPGLRLLETCSVA